MAKYKLKKIQIRIQVCIYGRPGMKVSFIGADCHVNIKRKWLRGQMSHENMITFYVSLKPKLCL